MQHIVQFYWNELPKLIPSFTLWCFIIAWAYTLDPFYEVANPLRSKSLKIIKFLTSTLCICTVSMHWTNDLNHCLSSWYTKTSLPNLLTQNLFFTLKLNQNIKYMIFLSKMILLILVWLHSMEACMQCIIKFWYKYLCSKVRKLFIESSF